MAGDDKIRKPSRPLRHGGIAVSRDDPILVLQTINDRLMRTTKRQQEILEGSNRAGSVAHRWGEDSKERPKDA